jgi:hypothetical protein
MATAIAMVAAETIQGSHSIIVSKDREAALGMTTATDVMVTRAAHQAAMTETVQEMTGLIADPWA